MSKTAVRTTRTVSAELTFAEMFAIELAFERKIAHLKDQYLNPHPIARDLTHNTRGAAVTSFKVLAKLNPEAAERALAKFGHPYSWQ